MDSSSISFRENLIRQQLYAVYSHGSYDATGFYQQNTYVPSHKNSVTASQRRRYGNWDQGKYDSRINTANRKGGGYRSTGPSLSRRGSSAPKTNNSNLRNKAKMPGPYGIKSSAKKYEKSRTYNSTSRTLLHRGAITSLTQNRVSSSLRGDAASGNIAKRSGSKQNVRKSLSSASRRALEGGSHVTPRTQRIGDQVEPDYSDMTSTDCTVSILNNGKDVETSESDMSMDSNNNNEKRDMNSKTVISKLGQKDPKHSGLDSASKCAKGRRDARQIAGCKRRVFNVNSDPMRWNSNFTGSRSKYVWVRKEKPENCSSGAQVDDDIDHASLPKIAGTRPGMHGAHSNSTIRSTSADSKFSTDDSLVKRSNTRQRDNSGLFTSRKSIESPTNACWDSDARSETLKVSNQHHVDILSLQNLMDVKLKRSYLESSCTDGDKMKEKCMDQEASGDTGVKSSPSSDSNDTTEVQGVKSSTKSEESHQNIDDPTACTASEERLIKSPFDGECDPVLSPERRSTNNQFQAGFDDRSAQGPSQTCRNKNSERLTCILRQMEKKYIEESGVISRVIQLVARKLPDQESRLARCLSQILEVVSHEVYLSCCELLDSGLSQGDGIGKIDDYSSMSLNVLLGRILDRGGGEEKLTVRE